MAKIVGQWDRRAVASPSLNAIAEILDIHLSAIVASALGLEDGQGGLSGRS